MYRRALPGGNGLCVPLRTRIGAIRNTEHERHWMRNRLGYPAMQNQKNTSVRENGLPKQRRKQYIINPAFQWKYALTIASIVFLTSSALSSALYGFLHSQARQRMMDPEMYTAEVTGVILGFGLTLSVLTSGAVAAWLIVLTHRICGPLLVMERQLKELRAGRFPHIRNLRKKDEFKEFYATFAGMVSGLKSDKQNELEALNRVMALTQSALECDDDSRRHALEAVATQVAELRNAACQALGCDPDSVESVSPVANSAPEKAPLSVG